MTTSMSSSSTPATADHGGGSPIAAVHPDVIQSHILNRLDGPSLAATSCASAHFFSLCKDDHLWKDICAATWPSTNDPRAAAAISAFPAGHRSFYSDAFPALRHRHPPKTHRRRAGAGASELISAVDIYCDGELIHSRVLATETASTWFLNTPFRLELLDPKETVPTKIKTSGGRGACVARAAERLGVSWIVIDPMRARAVNVASGGAVEARRHWLTGEIQLCYASVVAGGLASCAVVVTCGGEEEGGRLRVKEVSLQVEEVEGRIMTGMESLGILRDAMEGERGKSDLRRERERYERFVAMKVRCRERKIRRESGLDMVCTAAGICIFFAFWIFFLST